VDSLTCILPLCQHRPPERKMSPVNTKKPRTARRQVKLTLACVRGIDKHRRAAVAAERSAVDEETLLRRIHVPRNRILRVREHREHAKAHNGGVPLPPVNGDESANNKHFVSWTKRVLANYFGCDEYVRTNGVPSKICQFPIQRENGQIVCRAESPIGRGGFDLDRTSF